MGTIADDEYAFLKSQLPGVEGTLTDLRMKYFGDTVGLPGTINDLTYEFFKTHARDYWTAPPADPSIAFLYSQAGNVGSTVKTWAAVPFGTEDPDRIIYVAIGGRAAYVISSITIGGVTAAVDVSTSDSGIWLASAKVPTGTSGDVVATWTGNQTRASIIAWAINDVPGAFIPAVTQVLGTSVGTIAAPDNSLVIAAAYWNNVIGTITWTELIDAQNIDVSAVNAMSSAYKFVTSAASVDLAVSNTGGSTVDIIAAAYVLP